MIAFRPLLLALLAVPSLGAQSALPRKPATEGQPPTLVVFITVDQLRADYLDRFRKQLTGGLGRLLRGGAVMDSAFQDHAVTETAPGHSVTMSGRYPASTGIVKNSTGVEDPKAPLIDAPGEGASPMRFRGGTLTDWLLAKDPRTRVLSVSRKDRGAILPVGRSKQSVFWYGANGHFTTSHYYADTLPTWVRRFNERRIPQRMAGGRWTLLLPASAYPEPDSVAQEDNGREPTFPHTLPADTALAARVFPNFPWMDQLTLGLAIAGLREMRLGADSATDVLAVSLSTTDAIGHRFGPDSREIHDQVLRLDRALGTFLDSLFAMRDPSRVVIALTADHGATSYPEIAAARGDTSARRVDVAPVMQRTATALAARGVDSTAFDYEGGMVFLDRAALTQHHVNADSVLDSLAAETRATPGVMRVDRVSALATADTVHDVIARRWLHALTPELPVELVVTLGPHDYPANVAVAMHGSPHDDDAHVPMIFYGTPFRPGRYETRVAVVDMAPTLAAVTNTPVTERVDGHVLTNILRR